jgi:hypothetical protein
MYIYIYIYIYLLNKQVLHQKSNNENASTQTRWKGIIIDYTTKPMPYNEGNKNDIIIVHDLITRTTNKNIQKKKNKKQHEQQNNHSG